MPTSKLTLRAEKSRAYFESLCKHFARKVQVDRNNNRATVFFSAGECEMLLEDKHMSFHASANDPEALNIVKAVISSHAVRFGELRNTPMEWSD